MSYFETYFLATFNVVEHLGSKLVPVITFRQIKSVRNYQCFGINEKKSRAFFFSPNKVFTAVVLRLMVHGKETLLNKLPYC